MCSRGKVPGTESRLPSMPHALTSWSKQDSSRMFASYDDNDMQLIPNQLPRGMTTPCL
jgi:hypothetical protein